MKGLFQSCSIFLIKQIKKQAPVHIIFGTESCFFYLKDFGSFFKERNFPYLTILKSFFRRIAAAIPTAIPDIVPEITSGGK